MDIEATAAIKLFFPKPSLVQVFFEALANSLDANATEISIKIQIDGYTAPETLRVTIKDNGDGFNDENFTRFSKLLTPKDSFHKGLGRLIYLNYFDRVEVDSVWENKHRTFTFSENFKGKSITNKLEKDRPKLTTLIFSSFKGKRIKTYDDLKPGSLKEKIIEQFLPTLHRRKIDKKPFKIKLILEAENEVEEKDFFSMDETVTELDIPDLKSVEISDSTLDAFETIQMFYQIKSGTGEQNIVTSASIDGRTIPMKLVSSSSIPIDHTAMFLFVSNMFEGKADTSRQRLELPENISELDLYAVLRHEIGKVLNESIVEIQEKNQQTKTDFEETYPHLLGYIDENTVGIIDKEEALDIAQKKLFIEQKKILQAEKLNAETYEKSLELSSRSLTQYILYRDKIIRRMKDMEISDSEADIHELIVPRYRSFDSEELCSHIYRNNAWLLDLGFKK